MALEQLERIYEKLTEGQEDLDRLKDNRQITQSFYEDAYLKLSQTRQIIRNQINVERKARI